MAKSKSTSSSRPSRVSSRSAAKAVNEDDRHRLIAEAAYLRAQSRNFRGGDPVDDWLVAEREINRQLPSPQQQKKELAAYRKLRTSVGKLLADAKETLSADTIRQTLDDARTQLRQLGDYTADTVEKAIVSVEKEMLSTGRRAGAQLENLAGQSADLFAVWRDRGTTFLGRAATAVRDWAQQVGARVSDQTYHTGDIAADGILECTACGARVEFKTPAHVPLCPQCRKSDFRRIAA